MAEYEAPDPVVELLDIDEIANDLLVIPNRGVQLVPNIGLIGGDEAVLIVDTGMGPRNAERVLQFAVEHAAGRRLYLTTTHFHPEHAFGAATFAGEATFLINQSQADDLTEKGPGYLEMFRGLGEGVAAQLEGVTFVDPDLVYDSEHTLDLGGRTVELKATGRAHSRGDQVITVPDAGVMFTGDLVETGQFSIFPWFPPHDTDVSGIRWIDVMNRLIDRSPATVVPGHGTIGGTSVLIDVRDYLTLLRDETWKRRDSDVSEDTTVAEVQAHMLEVYPEWEGQEWIAAGVGCLCSEHAHK